LARAIKMLGRRPLCLGHRMGSLGSFSFLVFGVTELQIYRSFRAGRDPVRIVDASSMLLENRL
jgi:hypothetical protein